MKFMNVCRKFSPTANQAKAGALAFSLGVVAASSQATSLIA
jgi:hypothetical protein